MEFSRQEYWGGLPFLFSKGYSQTRDWTQVSWIACRLFTIWATREVQKNDTGPAGYGNGVAVVVVAQSCLTLCDPMDCNLPGSSVHGILQARIQEWVAISISRGSSQPRDQTWVSFIVGRFVTIWTTRKAPVSLYQPSGVGWGERWEGGQKGGDICTPMADSRWSLTENSKIL